MLLVWSTLLYRVMRCLVRRVNTLAQARHENLNSKLRLRKLEA